MQPVVENTNRKIISFSIQIMSLVKFSRHDVPLFFFLYAFYFFFTNNIY